MKELTPEEIEEVIADIPSDGETVDLQDIYELIVLKLDPTIPDPSNPPTELRPFIRVPMAIAWCLFRCELKQHILYKGEDWDSMPSLNLSQEVIDTTPCYHVPDGYHYCLC